MTTCATCSLVFVRQSIRSCLSAVCGFVSRVRNSYWKRDERPGEHGFTWAHYYLLLDEAGTYALQIADATDPLLRQAFRNRECALNDIAQRILPFLPARYEEEL